MTESRTPRVLLVNQSGVYGGAEFQLVELAAHWGPSARVLLFSDGPVHADLAAAGVSVNVLSAADAFMQVRRETRHPSPRAVGCVLRLAREVAACAAQYDVIYANSQKAMIVAAVAAFLARKPLVWHLHDIFDTDHFSTANTRIAVLLANLIATRVLANSKATGCAFVANGGARRKVRVLPYGIESGPFLSVSDAAVAELRTSLGLTDAPVVGVFGRLASWKGQHIALDAISGIPGVQLLIVGDAMFGESAYAAELHRQTAALGMTDRVRFLGFRSDVPNLMRLVDVVLHTSVAAEPFGRVILEGMLAGRPVIATDAGGAREIVQRDVTGMLIPPGDANALRIALSSLLSDAMRRRAFGEAGRQRAVTDFSPAVMLDRVDAELGEAIGAGR